MSEKQLKKFPEINEYIKNISNLEKEILEIKSKSGNILKAYYFKQSENNKKLIILSHGIHTEALLNSWYFARFYFNHKDFDILMLVHEGHKPSSGKYIGFGYKDAENIKLWVDKINEMTTNQYQIFLHGVSMGASSILGALKYDLKNVRAAIVESGYNSGYDEIKYTLSKKYHFPSFLILPYVRFLVKVYCGYDIKNELFDAVLSKNIPILFIHGTCDLVVPVNMTNHHFEICESPKEKWIVEDAKHAVGYLKKPIAYETKVINFINKHIV